MGLAASQTRYLSLTARKSDLEYQAQVINTRRIQLAEKSAQISKAYAEGMANKLIRISHYSNNTDGVTTKVWEELTYSNLIQQGYRLIGANGTPLIPSPYADYKAGDTISAATYKSLTDAQKQKCTYNEADGTYTTGADVTGVNPEYDGLDIQSLLVSGRAQIVSPAFYNYLVEHGYYSGVYVYDGKEISYEELVDKFEASSAYQNIPTIIDWRSDTTSTFKQNNYTEDDAQDSANYEAATAEIQAQDKKLELEIKNIETEHKAIETEMESVKKVIDKNIENSFKSFA